MGVVDKIFGDKASRAAEQQQQRDAIEAMLKHQQESWVEWRSSRNPVARFLARIFS